MPVPIPTTTGPSALSPNDNANRVDLLKHQHSAQQLFQVRPLHSVEDQILAALATQNYPLLQSLCWHGIPSTFLRAQCWPVLLQGGFKSHEHRMRKMTQYTEIVLDPTAGSDSRSPSTGEHARSHSRSHSRSWSLSTGGSSSSSTSFVDILAVDGGSVITSPSSNSLRLRNSSGQSQNYYLLPRTEDSKSPHAKLLHQIRLDVPRTMQREQAVGFLVNARDGAGDDGVHGPGTLLLQSDLVMERILYTWSVRRPAAGYVQGVNDLLLPFIALIGHPLNASIGSDARADNPTDHFHLLLESDCYWCFERLMDIIQDTFTSGQSSIYRQVSRLRAILANADHLLIAHLDLLQIDLFTITFRWFNCLLLRDLSWPACLQVWDCCLANDLGAEFAFRHAFVYYVVVILLKYSKQIRELNDFGDVMCYLQDLPCRTWGQRRTAEGHQEVDQEGATLIREQVRVLCAEAYMLQQIYWI